MKCTPLFKTHQKYGAKFTEFNGWNMPLWFSSLENEHLQVRADSGVFDVSHMGEIIIFFPSDPIGCRNRMYQFP